MLMQWTYFNHCYNCTLTTNFYNLVGRRGLVGLFTTHGAKGRWFASRLLFFFSRGHPSSRRKRFRKTKTMWIVKTLTRERRRRMDEPAGERGVATRNVSVRLSKSIKWWTPINKGTTWREKIINMLLSNHFYSINQCETWTTNNIIN